MRLLANSSHHIVHNKVFVQTQTTLRFVCTAQLDRYAPRTYFADEPVTAILARPLEA